MSGLENGLALYVVFLISTCFHEAAHAWTALKGGDPTAYDGGQVTLDPIPHIKRHPIGMVVLPLLSAVTIGWPIGFASAPFNPRWAQEHPDRAGLMSLAGPGANLALVLSSGLLINLGLFFGVFDAPESIRFAGVTVAAAGAGPFWQATAYILGAIFAMNLLLAVFNLLPVPPLDGSSALVLLLPEKLAGSYQGLLLSNPALGGLGIFVAWQVCWPVFDPVFTQCLNLLYWLHGTSYSF